MRKPLIKAIITLSTTLMTLLGASSAFSAGAWYAGKIQFIYLYNGGFNIDFVGSSIDDCLHERIYVKQSTLGAELVDRAYAMALSAQASGRTLSVVVDKAINGPGGECEAINGSMLIRD